MSYRINFKTLASVCDIQSGFTARGRLEPLHGDSTGLRAIQLRDLPDEGPVDPSTMALYEMEGFLDRYQTRAGDILFRSRGQRNTAVVVATDTKETAIAVLPLLILRPIAGVLDPHYLAWFINERKAQRHFKSCARGTNIRMIPKKCLEDLEVPIPDMETQKRIAEINALAQRERALTLELAEKKLKFTNFALLSQVQSARPHGNEAGRSDPRRSKRTTGKIRTD